MSARVVVCLCVALGIHGCGGVADPGPSAVVVHGSEESGDLGFPRKTPALYPFTAAELRASIRAGRRYFYRTEHFYKKKMHEYYHVYGVAQATESTVTTYAYPTDDAGQLLLVPSPFQRTWEAMAREIGLSAEFVRAGEATLLTPAGDFECEVYVRHYARDGDEWETVYYFAKSLPGPAIKHAIYENGEPSYNRYVLALWP